MITDLEVKRAKTKDKPYLIRDDRGLYLRVDPTGRKYWILRYWEAKREHQKSLGPYPDISLRDARLKRDEIQAARARGESPTAPSPSPRLFSEVVSEWITVRMKEKSEGHLKTIRLRLDKYILPALGGRQMDSITSRDVLQLCRNIEALGHTETARRVKTIISQVFRFAIAAEWAVSDPTAALLGALAITREKHYPTLTMPEDIGLLVRSIKGYPYAIMRGALLFSLYTFARPGEVRAAEWSEIRENLWDIPAGKMKMKRRHLVPLSRQAQGVLEGLRPFTGEGRWLFPSPRNDGRCMSENGVRVALRSLGFGKETIVPHGFRAMASTILNENQWNRDVIERQLAHAQSGVRGAYNHAEYMEERVRMMQWWADWLDGLAASSPIEEAGPTSGGRGSDTRP